jgi:hypothetical protein
MPMVSDPAVPTDEEALADSPFDAADTFGCVVLAEPHECCGRCCGLCPLEKGHAGECGCGGRRDGVGPARD